MTNIQILIVVCFGFIHLLEYSSFLSRVAGIKTHSKMMSYTIQQAVFVLTRFFFIAMMPLIGFIVDKQASNESYLMMVHCSLLIATVSYFLVLLFSSNIIGFYIKVFNEYEITNSLPKAIISSILKPSFHEFSHLNYKYIFVQIKNHRELKVLILYSAIVFSTYSIGVFIAFYAALNYYDYRSTIGQMSGIINASATVLLTFYVEPRISLAIDRNEDNADVKVMCLLFGRLIGVAILSQIIIGTLWLTVV